jgi:hypothetical protein
MIEKLEINIWDNNDYKITKQRINKIIDWIQEHNLDNCHVNNGVILGEFSGFNNEQQDSKLKECLDCNNHNTIICESCQNNAMFKKIQKPKVENINVDDMYIAEKKIDKLKEAYAYQYIVYKAKALPLNEEVVLFEKYKEEIDLFKQAIEQVIKEKEKEIEDYKQQKYDLIDDNYELNRKNIELKQLKQKKPPRKCIEWLKRYDCSECANELLNFFGEN